MPKHKTQLHKKTLLVFSVTLAFITGLALVGSSSRAQELLGTGKSSKIEPFTQEAKTIRSPRIPNFDIRLSASSLKEQLSKSSLSDVDSAITDTAATNRTSIEAAVADLKRNEPDVEVSGSVLTGAVEIVRSATGMTEPSGRSGLEIVRRFISENRGIYGLDEGEIANLNFIGESISPDSGLRMVRVEQVINGRPVFQSETRFILDREGRIVRSLGLMVPKASETAELLTDLLSPEEALRRTMAQFNVSLETEKMNIVASEDDGYRTEMRVDDPNIGGRVTSKLVYFPVAPGILVPAWSQIVFGIEYDWYVLVDARDGTQLWRKNIRSDVSTHDARFRVFVQADGKTPADSPAPQSPSAAVPGGNTQYAGIAPSIVSMFFAQSLTASPNGWIDDCPGGVCTAAQTQTLGNNVLSCVDRAGVADACDVAGVSALDGNGRPTGNTDSNARNRDFLGTTTRDFESTFLPAPQGGNPEAGQTSSSGAAGIAPFLRASAVHQFYVTNWYHDQLFALGFDTAAGNFQNNIFGGGGVGNDRVLVDVQDGSGTDNANFSTPPDGTSGRAQMYNFTGPTIDRDGGLDAEILIHELTHGTSNRIIGNGAGLAWDIGGGMGEGWSDFYALSLLNNTNADNPDGQYASGAYATYKAFGVVAYQDNYVYGIRRFPYSTNNAVNPLTWGDVDQTTNNLSGGIAADPLGFNFGGALEVHNVGEVWTLTLWEVRSRIIAANAGSVPTGNQIALQLVTDAMKLTPDNPTFIQARDALIDADCATNACANEDSIWGGFADRGLGYGAKAGNSVSFAPVAGHMGIVESFATPNLELNSVAITDTIGNNSGFVDPGEAFRFEINVRNPFRRAARIATGVTATLSSSTPGVLILNPSTTYPTINPNGNANRNAFNIVAKAPLAAGCGSTMSFTLTINSSLGAIARTFSLRLGQPTGTVAPVTYTRSALGLAILDNRPNGTMDTLTVADDFEIADLNVRIDSLTHTNVGQLTFGIRGPNGYGTDVLAYLGGAAGGNTGDNFVNTVFDDESATDVLLEPTVNQPFTKSFKPIFNSPTWAGIGFPPAEVTPQLSNFDGSSTLGTWRAIAADEAAGTAGVLQGWSLIVTPRSFTCTPLAPTAAHVRISGRVIDVEGRGLGNVLLTLTDSAGHVATARANAFGYFEFDDVEAGQTYLLAAQAKRYSFSPQVLSVQDDVVDLVITAE
jgi:subtilisin-like proprotein convertase family protein